MNGWFTEPETYGSENIAVPIYNWFVEDDGLCPKEPNIVIGDMIPTQGSRITFDDGLSHGSIIAQTNARYVTLIDKFLGDAEAIEGDCQTLVFDQWQ